MAMAEPPDDHHGFWTQGSEFTGLLGEAPSLELLAHNGEYAAFHEAAVFVAHDDCLVTTSQPFTTPAGEAKVQISLVIIDRTTDPVSANVQEIHAPIFNANGGVNSGRLGVIFCQQGNRTENSALVYMPTTANPDMVVPLVTSFNGHRFSSINDVVQKSDSSIWFTDPDYGFAQGFRPQPELPCQVYRAEFPLGEPLGRRETSSVTVVADGFDKPNGLCFSPDESILYVTDTGRIRGDGTINDSGPATIYAFDVATGAGRPFLANRRLFAHAEKGVPDGIKCDVHGNVYAGCGEGINVWSADGVLIGKILVSGGIANFCFGKEGEMFLLNEHRLWRAQMAPTTKGAMLRI